MCSYSTFLAKLLKSHGHTAWVCVRVCVPINNVF